MELQLCPACNAFVNNGWESCAACGASLHTDAVDTPATNDAVVEEEVEAAATSAHSEAEPESEAPPVSEPAFAMAPAAAIPHEITGDAQSGFTVRWGATPHDRFTPSPPPTPLTSEVQASVENDAMAVVEPEPEPSIETSFLPPPLPSDIEPELASSSAPEVETSTWQPETWEAPQEWSPGDWASSEQPTDVVVAPNPTPSPERRDFDFTPPASPMFPASTSAVIGEPAALDNHDDTATDADGFDLEAAPSDTLQSFTYDSNMLDYGALQAADSRVPGINKKFIIAGAIVGPIVLVIIVLAALSASSNAKSHENTTATTAKAKTATPAEPGTSNGWINYADPEHAFTVELPAAPQITHQGSDNGPMTVYTSQGPGGHLGVVIVKSSLPKGTDWENNQEVLKNALNATRNSSGMEVKGNIMERRAGVQYLDATLSNGKQLTNVRYFVRGNTLFGLAVTSDEVNGNPDAYDQLTQSFEVGVTS